jgi:hypothetical protein
MAALMLLMRILPNVAAENNKVSAQRRSLSKFNVNLENDL